MPRRRSRFVGVEDHCIRREKVALHPIGVKSKLVHWVRIIYLSVLNTRAKIKEHPSWLREKMEQKLAAEY
jgi:hypothetical protein